MNFLRGRMQADGAHLRFEAERLSLTLPRHLVRPDALRDGVAVTLGVRPEDVASPETASRRSSAWWSRPGTRASCSSISAVTASSAASAPTSSSSPARRCASR